jgi:hypothetical protein
MRAVESVMWSGVELEDVSRHGAGVGPCTSLITEHIIDSADWRASFEPGLSVEQH